MKLKHAKDEHPLILSEEKNDDRKIFCNGCAQLISGFTYSCRICSFFLHKFCAELPAEIKHPMHPQHPLTLLSRRPIELFVNPSSVQRSLCFKSYVYGCEICGFDLELDNALRVHSIEHKSHEHPLSPLLSLALFTCDACGTKHQGISYMCNTCSFWIHQDCASLPTTFKHGGHGHRLTLAYSPSDINLKGPRDCRICKEQLEDYYWFYHCEGCQYFAHLKCSTMTMERKSEIEDEDLDEAKLIHLPVSNDSVHLLSEFVRQISHGDNNKEAFDQISHESYNLNGQFAKQLSLVDKREVKINHFSQNHLLTLFDAQSNEDLCSQSKMSIVNKKKNDKVCDVCVQPISAPFYGCSLCDFLLHKLCAELPTVLKHPCHSHQLILFKKNLEGFDIFKCIGCRNICNGYTFTCVECKDYYLDIKCAALPKFIMHEVHEHPLKLRKDCQIEGCVACDRSVELFSFGCSTCNFNLHYTCALLPRTITHRYDEHPFILTYNTIVIEDDPDEYICEFCEEDINPNFWFYHCVKCDHSACARCIYKEEEIYPNINWGSTYNFDGHCHPLTLVVVTNKNTICDYCDGGYRHFYNGIGFKCVLCNFMFHPFCAFPRAIKA
ncbi:unnamed protein product [Camellia sinensis]